VVATIRDKMFDGLVRTWELLYLVKDDECVASYETNMGHAFEIQEERIKVVKVFIEYPPEFGLRLAEINKDITCVFSFCKLFNDIAFPDSTCPDNQQSGRSVTFFLPLQKLIVDFASHRLLS